MPIGYERLTKDFKDKILTTLWNRYRPQVLDEYGIDLVAEGLELRHRCQTDGFWLAKEILGYREFSECHRELFSTPNKEGFFVLKDPGASDFKTFAEAYTDLHDRLVMLSRGGFKSSADIVDSIQWFICFPYIRINIMTGTSSLAEEFVGIIKSHFTLAATGGDESKEKKENPYCVLWPSGSCPTLSADRRIKLIQLLFPEHCEIKPGESPEWTTPGRQNTQVAGPTLRATSLDKNTTGTHCDLLKVDDGTNAENTRTADRIKSVNYAIGMARKLCEPYGFIDRIGTPYAASDNLCMTLKDEETRQIKGEPALIKILMHPAYIPKPGFEDLNPDELKDDMVRLWFPERLTLNFLKKEYAESLKFDPAIFFSQYLLDIHRSGIVKFRRDLMVQQTIDKLPDMGVVFQAWDLAYSEKDFAKFTVGIAGLFTPMGIYICDMVRDRFSEYDLPRAMAGFAHKWKPRIVAVEDSMGARWLMSEIRREMERLRINVPFDFVSLGRGSKESSKEEKAKPAARLLGDKRLWFWKSMEGLQEAYNELEAFPKGTFKDIVCSLSLLVNHFKPYIDVPPAQPTYISNQVERARYELLYGGTGPYAAQTNDQNLISQYGPQPMDSNPLQDLMA